MEKIKLLIIDDHKVMRSGIKLLFKGDKNIKIVGEASDGKKGLAAVEKLKPNVVMTDISMPEMSGIELTKILKEKYPSINVLILSMHNDDEYVIDALEAGAMGYLPKDSAEEEIVSAVYSLGEGKMYYSRSISNVFAKKLLKKIETKNKFEKLTARELEVLELIVKGFSNKEIANKLFVSKRTIDNHRTNFMKKIAAKNTADIVRIAFLDELVKIS